MDVVPLNTSYKPTKASDEHFTSSIEEPDSSYIIRQHILRKEVCVFKGWLPSMTECTRILPHKTLLVKCFVIIRLNTAEASQNFIVFFSKVKPVAEPLVMMWCRPHRAMFIY